MMTLTTSSGLAGVRSGRTKDYPHLKRWGVSRIVMKKFVSTGCRNQRVRDSRYPDRPLSHRGSARSARTCFRRDGPMVRSRTGRDGRESNGRDGRAPQMRLRTGVVKLQTPLVRCYREEPCPWSWPIKPSQGKSRWMGAVWAMREGFSCGLVTEEIRLNPSKSKQIQPMSRKRWFEERGEDGGAYEISRGVRGRLARDHFSLRIGISIFRRLSPSARI